MAFGGLKKLIRKNKKGLKKLAGKAVGVAVSAALPVIGSKLATTGVGIVKRVAGAPARRKAAKEKEGKINAALAAQIAKPQLAMTASRETAASSYRPGGAKAPSSGRKTGGAMYGPGGATVSQMSKAAASHKGDPLGIAGSVSSFIKREQKARAASNKAKAAAQKKAAAAEKKAAAAALRKQKAAEKKAAAAAKKAEKNAKPSALQGIAASALGVKIGKTRTAKALGSKIKNTLVSGTKRAVKGKAKNYIPAATATAGILAAGGHLLDANAKAQVKKAEKKLGRPLNDTERKLLTTPVNTFSGK